MFPNTRPSTVLQVLPVAFWILLKVSTAHPVNNPPTSPVHFLLYFPSLRAPHKTDSCNRYIRFHSIVLSHHECKSQPQSTRFS
jgi:hypothetical protein